MNTHLFNKISSIIKASLIAVLIIITSSIFWSCSSNKPTDTDTNTATAPLPDIVPANCAIQPHCPAGYAQQSNCVIKQIPVSETCENSPRAGYLYTEFTNTAGFKLCTYKCKKINDDGSIDEANFVPANCAKSHPYCPEGYGQLTSCIVEQIAVNDTCENHGADFTEVTDFTEFKLCSIACHKAQ